MTLAPPPTPPPPALPCNDLQPPGQGKWFAAVPSNRGVTNTSPIDGSAFHPPACRIVTAIELSASSMYPSKVAFSPLVPISSIPRASMRSVAVEFGSLGTNGDTAICT